MSFKICKYSKKVINFISLLLLIIIGGGFLMETGWIRGGTSLFVIILQLCYRMFNIQRIDRKLFSKFYIVSAFFIFHALIFINKDISLASYIFFLLETTGMVLLLSNTNQDNFIRLYNSIVTILCTYSLILYFINLLFDFTDKGIVIDNRYILFLFQNIRYISRNAGPFWEPGIFQIYILIALFFTFYVIKNNSVKDNLFRIILYILTILTTRSTTGYAILAFLISTKLLIIYKEIHGKLKGIIFILSPILIIILSYFLFNSQAVQNKLFTGHISLTLRKNDLLETIPILFDAGFIGLGAGSYARQMLLAQHNIVLDGLGNSVAISSAGASYGWPFVAIFIFSCFSTDRKSVV